jgi:hypothetical protein
MVHGDGENYLKKIMKNKVKKTKDICVIDIQDHIRTNPDLILTDLGNFIGDALDLNIRWTNIKEQIHNPDQNIGHFTITKKV